LALVERSGETVGKNELIAQVWPDVIVEEGSLRVHMSALRKALGDGQIGGQRYIANIQRQGYRFVAPVMRQARESETRNTFARRSHLPAALGRMIDRDQEGSGDPNAASNGAADKLSLALVALARLRSRWLPGTLRSPISLRRSTLSIYQL